MEQSEQTLLCIVYLGYRTGVYLQAPSVTEPICRLLAYMIDMMTGKDR